MYGVDGRKFQRQYKQSISNFKNWKQKSHAEDWILYPETSHTNYLSMKLLFLMANYTLF